MAANRPDHARRSGILMNSSPTADLPNKECATGSRGTLLIVEDDVSSAISLQRLMQFEKYQVEVCHDGYRALEWLKQKRFDLVLLDLGLPNLNGHEVMKHIKRMCPDISVIMLSGAGTIDAAVTALKNGAYDFIRKPYQPLELLHTVENALNQTRLQSINDTISHQLQHSEDLYHYLVDSSPDIIYILDAAGHFTFVNQRVTSLLGFSQEEILGQHFSIIIHEEDLERVKFACNERRTGNRASSNVELRLKCKKPGVPFLSFETSTITIVLNARGLYGAGHEDEKPWLGTYGVARDISDRKKTEEALNYQAYHDTLTDLPNRALFKDRLNVSISQAERNKTRLGVMFLDLDRFKWVNDTLGHMHGDELLKIVATRLKSCLRKADTLARLGGDEFTVILLDINQETDIAHIAGKILSELQRPFLLDGREVVISASIGISIFPEHGDSVETLIKNADIAMYHVKWQGKNGFQIYAPSMNAVFNQKLSMENDLRKAIDTGQLQLYFQPQVDIDSRRIVGVEALSRWHHPARGWISPSEFIPLAEETGLISSLNEWLLDEACRHYRKWLDQGFAPMRLAINISPQSLEPPDFLDCILSHFARYRLDSSSLEIEITENLLMRDMENVITKLRELVDRDIKLAIDDFGTGYSSLAYLQKFPIDCIKIDKIFVQEIRRPDQEVPLINAITAIANGFHMNLVAEGVETLDQMQILHGAGCRIMQGFLFSKPCPAEEIPTLLANPIALFPHLS
jgi:diguanylate cyclase (GGDEF)-like protein/PAS domain S-box-containing protein